MRSTKYMARYYQSCGKMDEKRNERLFALGFGTFAFGLLIALTVAFLPIG